jgi:hypothetical protein
MRAASLACAVEKLEAARANKQQDDASAADDLHIDVDIDAHDRELQLLQHADVPELESPAQAVWAADRELRHAEGSVDASLMISEGTERKRIEDALDTDHLFVRRYLNS